MSDQDDPDVIEQAPRFSLPRMPWLPASLRVPTGNRPALLAAVVVAFALVAAGGSLAVLKLTSGPPDPLAGLITAVTSVPVSLTASAGTAAAGKTVVLGPSAPAGTAAAGKTVVLGGILPTTPPSSGSSAYSSSLQIQDVPVAVSGPPLTKAGKAEVLYVNAGYCPYCAEENWALIVALSRFGQFSGLTTSRSPQFEDIPPIDTWTFYGSSYTSPYLAFVPVETQSNVLTSPVADKGKASSYQALQQLTPAQQTVFDKYDTSGSTPFIDFANRAAQTGSGILPNLIAGRTWQQIAGDLRQPGTALGAALLAEAQSLTAELCRLTGDRPAAACS